MKRIYKKQLHLLSFILLGPLFSANVNGQEVVATSGDFSSTSQGSLSWTLGEIITETVYDGTNYLTQGFQQDYENLLAIEELNGTITFDLYPNPFTELITISSGREVEMDVTVLDAQGKEVFFQSLALHGGMKQTSLELFELSPGCYFVTIEIPELKYSTTKRMIKISTNE